MDTPLGHPITLKAYNPEWPKLYEEEKKKILDAIGNNTI